MTDICYARSPARNLVSAFDGYEYNMPLPMTGVEYSLKFEAQQVHTGGVKARVTVTIPEDDLRESKRSQAVLVATIDALLHKVDTQLILHRIRAARKRKKRWMH